MATYRIGIADFGDSFGACAFDLPGCWINGRARDEVIALAPIAVADYVAWLARTGRSAASPEDPQIEIVEEVRSADETAVEGEFCFGDDLRPLTDDAIAEGIRLMERSRADLLEALRCPDAVLDWRPPRAAMARLDPWKPDTLTIREIAADVASAESYYRTGLSDGHSDSEPDEGLYDLALQRQRLVDVLRELTEDDGRRRFEPVRTWQTQPEHWTARKVIRRAISHERFHTAEIRQRLAWLQLGVPRFREG